MLLREKSTIKILLVLLLIFAFSPNLSRAQTEISYSSGNAVAKPETIERIVRMSIAEVLKGRSTGANLSF